MGVIFKAFISERNVNLYLNQHMIKLLLICGIMFLIALHLYSKFQLPIQFIYFLSLSLFLRNDLFDKKDKLHNCKISRRSFQGRFIRYQEMIIVDKV